MIRAIIVEDEGHCSERLIELVRRHAGNRVLIEGVYETVDSGVKALRERRPELVFLDVQVKDRSGFDVLQETRELTYGVIFTTAYDRYAVQAFQFSAIDYLLKPVAGDELLRAIDRFEGARSAEDRARRLEALLHNLLETGVADKRIGLPVASGLIFVQVSMILRCESSSNYTLLFTTDGKKLVVSKTLKEFEALLTPYRFFRVHHSHLVNLRYIKNYQKGQGGTVTLTDDTIVEVSTRRKEEFLAQLNLL
ncbi:MAG TPA: LytTR family DNA-binding domain-containing protein [Puia sp.]|uniref:LytR/AlgR family response regulator transcription factor n=1 Tax=Puia sp. TaxID=2045100 RepID=UPI002B558333|nr:LytTR family DNA-binding domain-containing protein [Puia sp.]HVU95731.1 LytTR family DNA-binding domain-containing protein [Puia sp.]